MVGYDHGCQAHIGHLPVGALHSCGGGERSHGKQLLCHAISVACLKEATQEKKHNEELHFSFLVFLTLWGGTYINTHTHIYIYIFIYVFIYLFMYFIYLELHATIYVYIRL